MQELELDLEIYDLWIHSFWKNNILHYLIILIVLLLLTSLVLIYLKQSQRKKIEKIITVEDILQELIILKKNGITDINGYKIFYSNVIILLKQYIMLEFEVNLDSKTEHELIAFLKENNFTEKFFIALNQIIANAEIVKFSTYSMDKVQFNYDLELLIDMIRERNSQKIENAIQ